MTDHISDAQSAAWRSSQTFKTRKQEVPAESIYKSVGVGWWPILDDLFQGLFALGWQGQVDQVKEKFGGLRVYVSWSGMSDTDYFLHNQLIMLAEKKSSETCEVCGQPGKIGPTSHGWLKTLCPEHHAK